MKYSRNTAGPSIHNQSRKPAATKLATTDSTLEAQPPALLPKSFYVNDRVGADETNANLVNLLVMEHNSSE